MYQGQYDRILLMRIPKQYRVLDAEALGKLLGYTRSTVHTHVSRERWDKIPKPDVKLGARPIWYEGSVQEWRERQGK
jgi:predicted DNA-binding transcriptional regulator AlpA